MRHLGPSPHSAGSPSSGRRGAAVVEFAVVGPVLIILVFGMIEFGRIMMVSNVLTNAAREGGRQAVLAGSTTTTATDAVTSYLSANGISGHTTTVSPDPATASAGTSITVRVTIPAKQISWLPFSLYSGDSTLAAAVVMRKESSSP